MIKKYLVSWKETRVVQLGEQPSGATRKDPNGRLFCRPLPDDSFPFVSRFGGDTVVFAASSEEAGEQMQQISSRLNLLDIVEV